MCLCLINCMCCIVFGFYSDLPCSVLHCHNSILACPVLSCIATPYSDLPCSVLHCPHPILTCPVLSCTAPTLFWLALFCLALPHSILTCPVLSCIAPPYSDLPCSVLHCPTLFWLALFCLALPHPILTCPVLSCIAPLYSDLACSVLHCPHPILTCYHLLFCTNVRTKFNRKSMHILYHRLYHRPNPWSRIPFNTFFIYEIKIKGKRAKVMVQPSLSEARPGPGYLVS